MNLRYISFSDTYYIKSNLYHYQSHKIYLPFCRRVNYVLFETIDTIKKIDFFSFSFSFTRRITNNPSGIKIVK